MSGQGYVIPGFPSPLGPNDARIVIYGYRPSLVFAIIAMISFAIAGLLHTWQAQKYKTKFFSMVILACIFEIVGYVFRALSHVHPYDVRFFVVQYFFLVVSPVLYSASIYACLSVLVRGKAILITFVTLDVVTTIIQIAGAAGIGSSESNQQDPTSFNNVLIGGLAVQTFSFLVFLLLLLLYIRSVWQQKQPASIFGTTNKIASRQQLVFLLLAAILVFARTVFRLGEAADGVLGPASSNEVLFAMLDYFPIILAVISLSIAHPGRYMIR